MKIINYSAKAIAVVGDDTKQVKAQLKAIGGRFNPRLNCGVGWIFPASKRDVVEKFLNNPNGVPNAQVDDTAKLKEEYLAEMRKVWGNDNRMIDFENKQYSGAVRLSNGGLLVFKKPNIKRDFCFGYSLSIHDTESYDEANRMADHAATSEDYFLQENMNDINNCIERLENFGVNHAYLHRVVFAGQTEPLNVWEYVVMEASKESFKPSPTRGYDGIIRYVNEYRIGEFYYDLTEMSDADRSAILKGLKEERGKLEKRLKSYLKRYGTSKLKTWSYWRDE